jgi:very-short-patch-repair endonuclease
MKPRGKRYISPARQIVKRKKVSKVKVKSKRRKSILDIKESCGEKLIALFLDKYGILYEREKSFKGCINPRTKASLRYDFFLPTYNLCIEFDGKQHFFPSKDFYGVKANQEFCKQIYRDGIKTEFCNSNNISLLRINYKQYDEIDLILKEVLKFC